MKKPDLDTCDGRMKACCGCKIEKARLKFSRDRTRKDGLHPYCKSCDAERYARPEIKERRRIYNAEYHARPEVKELQRVRDAARRAKPAGKKSGRDTHLMRSYGMSPEQYAEHLANQSGVCAICRQAETEKLRGDVKALAVDHCHKTGRIRGLLCSKCNGGIGRLQDSPRLLIAAVKYLTESYH